MFSYVFICFLSPSYTKILTSRFSTRVFLPAPCNSKRRRELGKGGSVGRYTSARHSTWGLRSTREKWGVFWGASTREKKTRNPKKIGSWSNWWAMIFGQERIECWKNWERLVSNNWGISGSKMCTIYPSNVQTCANSGRFNPRKYGNWSKKSKGCSSLSTRFYTRWNCGFV